MLSDSASWEARTWELRPAVLPRLVHALECLFERSRGDVVFEALWAGENAATERRLTEQELLDLVAAGTIGTKTRYIASAARR
jgi:hypothetical protein